MEPKAIALTALILFFMASSFVVSCYGIAGITGWSRLARSFRTQRPLPSTAFTTSANLRYGAGYHNALRAGADAEGLYLSTWLPAAHPRLFIPWSEITIQPPGRTLFFRTQRMLLGRDLQIPFTIRQYVADKLLAAAGRSTAPP